MQMKVKLNKTLDYTDLYCPEPVIRTRMELDKLRPGEILEVLVDDPAAKEDIIRLAKQMGHEILEFESVGSHSRFVIKKAHNM